MERDLDTDQRRALGSSDHPARRYASKSAHDGARASRWSPISAWPLGASARPSSNLSTELTETTAAVDRYLIAFERGTLDDDAPEIQARLSALNQSKALRAGKAELPADLTKIGAEIRHILMN
jgi:hypothetical protein